MTLRCVDAELRRYLGDVFKRLAAQRESRIEEGHLLPDHDDLLIAISLRYAVAQVIELIKGKTAIHLARLCSKRNSPFRGTAFLGARLFVSMVSRDEALIHRYIRKQEREDIRLD